MNAPRRPWNRRLQRLPLAFLPSLLAVSCAQPLVLGPAPTSTTLQATAAIEKDPEVAKALADLTPAQRDLTMRVLQKVAQREAPVIAAEVKKGRSESDILADLMAAGDEGGKPGGGGPEVTPEVEDEIHDGEGGVPDNTEQAPPRKVELPPAVYRKVEVPPTAPVLGPKAAKITLVLFSDFQCPFCGRVEGTLAALRERYGDQLRIVWRNQPLPFHDRAMPSARAAMAAHRQGKFWPYHDKLFSDQRSLDDETLRRYAADLGLDLKRFEADRAAEAGKGLIDADIKQAHTYGADGTPTSFINGRQVVGAQPVEMFKAAIDAELALADKLLARGVKLDQLYPTILREMKETPAERPAEEPAEHADVKIPADAPVRGAKGAPVTIVEFSDFQCPFCGRVTPTLDALAKKYGSKLRVVFMHQPLPFHNNAELAAEASMAAHAQGKFWPYHDKLFANQRALEREDLERYAAEVGLDVGRFKKALDDHTFANRIRADSEEGSRVGARGTPSFFINGEKFVGAQPQERFEAVIDRALEAAGPHKGGKGGKKK